MRDECHGEASFLAETAFGFVCAVSDRSEGTFDGIGCSNVLPVFGWEVKLNNVEPYAYLKATLEAIAQGHPANKISELMPRKFQKSS